MRVYEFTNAEEQFDLLTRIVNLTRSQIKDEHLLRDMGTTESSGESTLDFVKRLVDNAFTEIDDWAMERSVGFVDVRVPSQKPTQSGQSTKPSTKKSVSVSRPVNVRPLKMNKKPVNQPIVTKNKKVQSTVPKSLENIPTIKSTQPTAMKTFSDINQS